MDYLVGCMSYISFCVTKFTFVEVIKGCIREIEYKQTKDFTADELQKLFLSVHWESGNYPEKLVRCTIPHELFLRGMVISWSGWFARLMMEKQSHFALSLVDPAYQGQYIGDELMKRIMSFYQNLLYVKVMPSDPKTIPFYERCGFQQYDNYSAMVRKHFL